MSLAKPPCPSCANETQGSKDPLREALTSQAHPGLFCTALSEGQSRCQRPESRRNIHSAPATLPIRHASWIPGNVVGIGLATDSPVTVASVMSTSADEKSSEKGSGAGIRGLVGDIGFSALVGAGAKLGVYPLSRIKMIAQAKTVSSFEAIRQWRTIEKGHWTHLWKGCGLSVARSSVQTGIQVPVFDRLAAYAKQKGDLTKTQGALINVLAGNGATMVVYPVEILATRVAVQVKNAKDLAFMDRQRITWNELKNLVKTGSLSQGVSMKMVSAAPFNFTFGMFFVGFNTAFEPLMGTSWSRYAAAALGASMASAFCHPLDSLTRKVQVSNVAGLSLTQAFVLRKGTVRETKLYKLWEAIHSQFGKTLVESRFDWLFRVQRAAYAGLLPGMIKCGLAYSARWGPKIDKPNKKQKPTPVLA